MECFCITTIECVQHPGQRHSAFESESEWITQTDPSPEQPTPPHTHQHTHFAVPAHWFVSSLASIWQCATGHSHSSHSTNSLVCTAQIGWVFNPITRLWCLTRRRRWIISEHFDSWNVLLLTNIRTHFKAMAALTPVDRDVSLKPRVIFFFCQTESRVNKKCFQC